jgi:two-component system sensor histidine kinase/response regulator
LEASNEELDAFAHTVAHDLKGPLVSMIGYAQVLESRHTALPAEELGDYLHSIAKGGGKMTNIIDELLLLASARQMTDVDTSPLDMASIVDQVRQRLDYMIEEYQAEIVLPGAWPASWGHGPWVEEVWTNYISNALKYGGQPPRVELGATGQDDDTVRFWVRDNGAGLTPEEQDRLFTPFTRLDQVRAKGHGLGLSIVRRIVERLGGQVSVESQVGQGSVFSFTLPATPR